MVGQTIEEICASRAYQQEGNKIKLTDLKSRGKTHLDDARKKVREEEKKRKEEKEKRDKELTVTLGKEQWNDV